jgi:hypothetical protein
MTTETGKIYWHRDDNDNEFIFEATKKNVDCKYIDLTDEDYWPTGLFPTDTETAEEDGGELREATAEEAWWLRCCIEAEEFIQEEDLPPITSDNYSIF